MKTALKNEPKPAVQQPVFHKVAENLYRLESSGGYCALIKKGGKQFRRSLKTKDRMLADRRLKETKERIGCLSLTDGTIQQREIRIKNLAPFFKGTSLRSVSAFQCERWAIERGAKLATQTF